VAVSLGIYRNLRQNKRINLSLTFQDINDNLKKSFSVKGGERHETIQHIQNIGGF